MPSRHRHVRFAVLAARAFRFAVPLPFHPTDEDLSVGAPGWSWSMH
jgi:hypothetical protein